MVRTLRWMWIGLAIAWCGSAWALPPLEAYRGQGLELQIPLGWTVTVDEAGGTVLISEDPNDPLSAALVLAVVPHQPGLDAAFLTDTVMAKIATELTELGREEGDGVVWTLQSFEFDGVPALVTSVAISRAEGSVASIALFSARVEDFEPLGCAALLFVTFGGADPALFETAAAPVAAPTPGSGSAATAHSFPPLEPIAELGGAYLKPAGWHYASESAPGQDLIYLLEDPAADHGAAILFLSQVVEVPPPAGTDVVAGVVASFSEALGLVDVTEIRRSGDTVTGARLLSATRLGRPTKAFFALFSNGRDISFYGIVAPAERFDGFGGHGLMWVTLGGMTVDAFERSDEMQAWYGPADVWGGGASDGSLAMQQM